MIKDYSILFNGMSDGNRKFHYSLNSNIQRNVIIKVYNQYLEYVEYETNIDLHPGVFYWVSVSSNLKNLDYASGLGKMSVIPITGGIATSKAIDILVNEMKALRQDMNAGKIGVYMDGAKVTSGIAVSSEKSTRNNFNYGQRT